MPALRPLTTVLGPLAPERAGLTDAHQHVWIEQVPGVSEGAPVLDYRTLAEGGLAAYRAAGGGTLVDCQPGGCGRNAAVLAELSRRSGVSIIAATGFHLRKYYGDDHWLWSATQQDAAGHFVRELQERVDESPLEGSIRAGFIKIACTANLADTRAELLAAAAEASRATGAAVLIHTEQGAAAEQIVERMSRLGADAGRLVLCHVDKRPDPALHQELADARVLLEYDTFFRPKYDPERNVWPLLERMLADGYGDSIALGTDLAEPDYWRRIGPAGLPQMVLPRLAALGCTREATAAMTGGNIVARLAGMTAPQSA